MSDLPSGTVTFLFTDIEGSTRLLAQMGEPYAEVLEQQRRLLRSAFAQWSGHEVDTQGDSFFVAFGRASDAVAAAVQAQRAVVGHSWPAGRAVRVRMGIHTGEPLVAGHGYVGLDVHRAARLAAAGHGGQVLLSQATRRLAEPTLSEDVRLRGLGRHRLRDLQQPEEISQVVSPGLPVDFPALRTLDGRSHNLPIQATPLIGREPELAAALVLLLSDDVRLLTLTGPGGSGKTRLGLQIAANAIDYFDDGIFFVALAPITDPALVPSSIARTLGVQEVSGRPVSEAVKDYLQGKRLLLVLDNFEQLLQAAGTVSELLAVCPQLKMLVTSRAVLRLYGEHHVPVSPLKLPDRRPLPPLQRLLQYESVRLFIERARAAKLDFSVTNDNAAAVAEICYRLDGLPLAIELAAARVRLLPPQAILARLERRLPLLIGGARDLPARQQTLRDTIAWSHALLNDREQRLYHHLGVFVGGSTLEAIEAVGAGGDRPSIDSEAFRGMGALEGVAALVDNSLLRQDEQEAGEPRFWMLETIREYALERLEASGKAPDARQCHADYYLSLAENAEPKLRGPTQREWLRRLETEHDNLRTALAWSLATAGGAEIGLRLAGALTWFWRMRGHVSEGRRWVEATLNSTAGLADRCRTKALIGGAFLVQGQGHNPRAIAMAEEGLALAKSFGDTAAGGWALHVVARAARAMKDSERSAKALDDSLSAFRDAGDVLGNSYSSWFLGSLLTDLGDYDGAAARLAQGLTLAREAGDPWSIACALHHTGLLAYLQGDYEQTVKVSKESLAIFQQLSAPWGISMPLKWLAMAAGAQGQLLRAARLFGAEEALRESIGLSYRFSGVAYQKSIEATRAALGDQAFEAARSDGRAMTLDAAVVHALDE